jgi:hypothetical protein
VEEFFVTEGHGYLAVVRDGAAGDGEIHLRHELVSGRSGRKGRKRDRGRGRGTERQESGKECEECVEEQRRKTERDSAILGTRGRIGRLHPHIQRQPKDSLQALRLPGLARWQLDEEGEEGGERKKGPE